MNVGALSRMWGVTLVLNFAGLLLFAARFSIAGVVEPTTLKAAGAMADTLGSRASWPAFVSAIAAGTVMTLFSWVVSAAETAGARLAASLVVGFVLAAPSLNHAIVGFGEMSLGLLAATAAMDWADLMRVVAIAIAGDFIGGVGLVFATRLAQVRGEPGTEPGWRAQPASWQGR